MQDHGISPRDLIWPIVVMFATLVGGTVLLAVFLPESRDITAIVSPLFAVFSSLSVMIGGWVVARRMVDKVDKLQEDTAEIKEQTNGKLHKAVEALAYSSALRALQDHARKEGQL
jgi:hypothetical protein